MKLKSSFSHFLIPSVALCAVFLTTLFIVISCQKSNNNAPDDNNNTTYKPEYVTASVSGRVLDDNNQPVSSAVVKAGSSTTTSDVNGNFRINNVSLDKNAGCIKIEKDGFFQGSRTIVVNAGVVNYVTIQLIKKTVSGTVSGSTGGSISVQGGGNVVFTGNSFVNTAGNSAYTGTVSVSTFFLNPTASNFNEIMPGTLRGINTANEQTGLQSFGMMAVELTGAGGEKLQLASGKTATLTFPIPSALLSQAPNTIPLWSFNDTTGLWKEEGTATKQGTNYVGTVNHFSFWNCDYPYGSLINFKAIVKDQNGNPFATGRVIMQVTSDTFTNYGSGYIDSTGYVGGLIPKGKTFQLKVYSKCNATVYTKDIGPFNTTADLGTITVNNPVSGLVTFSGTVINCSAALVTNGYVDVYLDNMHNHAAITNGSFSITINRCDNAPTTASVTPYDMGNSQGGSASSVQVSSATVNTGQLSACGTLLTQFLNYTLNSANVSYVFPTDSLIAYTNGSANSYVIWATRKTYLNDEVYLNFTASGVGSVPLNSVYIKNNQKGYSGGSMTLNITEWTAGSGGYMAGNFTGTVGDSFAVMPVNMTFRVSKQ